ncbi:PTS sugar transporter subunit IIB [Erwiniaceae bacterium BAC15a-03b]|uniref:PTS sugar transporter subunit IIB n=1 Tax=Winslowiella arboricola TaxID=2978220 RepID=A0A9J6PXX8_9GAMM|nr:PTS sugar transporter subunit IIB [Winslowiella arboricola]MCU5775283.1 PTS sugar transporter subunit IIB [Winslowiella arboricola]MCU5780320.1 PTS sugar transporter subunit IIB [Winslowiella arboricola]
MKIMAVCGAGLGSSFMMEMNIKKVLKKLEITADVDHSDLGSVTPDAADVFVMAKDIAYSANLPENKVIIINNIIDLKEVEDKISAWFNAGK